MGGIFKQVISTIILCYGCLGVGVTFVWPSSTLLLFKSENTTLDRPMTDGEASLLGSLSSIGALIGNPIAAILMSKIGRKNCALLAASTGVIAWAIISWTTRVEVVLAAILGFGLNGSMFLITPVYISDICQESIRGTMTSLAIVFYGLGTLVSNLLGSCLSYHTMIYVLLSLAIAGFLMLLYLKESPVVLMLKGNEEEAKKSIAFYRSFKLDSKELLQEIDKIKRGLNPDMQGYKSPEEEILNPDMKPVAVEKLSFIQFLKNSRSTRRALYTMFALMTSAVFQGMIVVMVYARPLFQKVIPEDVMSTTVCILLLCAITSICTFGAGYLADMAGRRILLLISSALTAFCCVIVGSLITFEWGPQWMIAVFIYIYAIMFTFGAGTVPFIMLAEVFLPEVKGYITMMVMQWGWVCNFCILYIFQPLVSAVGIGPVFYLFGSVSVITTALTYFFVPETKGLTVDVIQKLFEKRNGITEDL